KATMLNKSLQFNQIFQIIPRFFIEAIAITFVLITLLVLIAFGESTNSIFILLSVFGVAATQLLPALNRIMQAVTSIKYSVPALKVIYEELEKYQNYTNSIEDSFASGMKFEKNIHLENISYSYPDSTQALKNISLTIEKGKKTAFVGPSGSGKSTLVDLLMGFYTAQSSSIYIDDKQINSTKLIQRLFAHIPQQIILYDTSIKENIAFGEPKASIDETKVWECLKVAQLDDFVSNLNKGLDTFVGENGIRLSGGQRQMLGIARALYQNPQILVMDEVTSALDNDTEKEVTNVIKKLKDITIITIAHRLSTIEGYDVVYNLINGSLEKV
ncbi:ABC transporter ATP-binding protein, partial [Francisella orientalis]|uniref:ABC transporter ATP-binding protein n=1 Tax=Francisella orientalis TaxID=299583 RepID=UPI001906EEE5